MPIKAKLPLADKCRRKAFQAAHFLQQAAKSPCPHPIKRFTCRRFIRAAQENRRLARVRFLHGHIVMSGVLCPMEGVVTPEQRTQYLAMAERRARPGAGSGPCILQERTAHYPTPDLRCLQGAVPFVVVGGLATRLYMPERMTLDTDILVLADDAARAESALGRAGWKKQGPLSIGGSTWRSPDDHTLDLVALDEPWVAEAIRTPVPGPEGLPYVALPYLVLTKLTAGRLQDLADIGRMLGAAAEPALEAVRRVVRRYRPADGDDLESIIRLGRLDYKAQE